MGNSSIGKHRDIQGDSPTVGLRSARSFRSSKLLSLSFIEFKCASVVSTHSINNINVSIQNSGTNLVQEEKYVANRTEV